MRHLSTCCPSVAIISKRGRRVILSDWGLLLLVFVLYTRFPPVLRFIGDDTLAAAVLVVLFVGYLGTRFILVRPLVTARFQPCQSFALIGLYGTVGLLSLVYADETSRTAHALLVYAKDAAIAITVIFLVERMVTLRRIVWVLLAAGTIMGSIGLYQHLTHTPHRVYAGFAQVLSDPEISRGADTGRLAGPLGDPNYYAQILLVLLPLALDRFWHKRLRPLHILTVWALVVCGLSIVLTYSRGALVALTVMGGIGMMRYRPRPAYVLLALSCAIALLQLPHPYFQRVRTFGYLFTNQFPKESSFHGRLTENFTGVQMFVTHPLLGVGLGNFEGHYQEYARRAGFIPRQEERGAHSLYIEIAAETGLMGLLAFGILLWHIFRSTSRSQQMCARMGHADEARMIGAFQLGLIGYLTAALFLHAAYTHYFWLLAGIAMALPRVTTSELAWRGARYRGHPLGFSGHARRPSRGNGVRPLPRWMKEAALLVITMGAITTIIVYDVITERRAAVHFARAQHATMQGQWRQALADYAKAHQYDIHNPAYTDAYARSLYGQKRYIEAETLYRSGLEHIPVWAIGHASQAVFLSVRIYLDLARLYTDMRRWSEADHSLRQALGVYKELQEHRRAAFTDEVALRLHELAAQALGQEHIDLAQTWGQKARRLRRLQWHTAPQTYGDAFARSLVFEATLLEHSGAKREKVCKHLWWARNVARSVSMKSHVMTAIHSTCPKETKRRS